jgi:tryptophan synthase alpha chain
MIATRKTQLMNPIDILFGRLREQRQKALIPFLTAGDPDLEVSTLVARELAAGGGALLEIGFPYSDPVADGAVIQASYTRALEHGVRVDDIFAWSRRLGGAPPFAGGKVPLVAMASYSLIHRRGIGQFVSQAQASGFHGAVVPDLPVEESDSLARLAAARDFKLVQLITPTTPADRAARIASASTGFLYCVSTMGITGERDQLPVELPAQLERIRGLTDLPLCVGFGVSKPEHVRMLRPLVDGVIVGSAFIRRLEEAGTRPVDKVVRDIGALAQSLAAALDQESPTPRILRGS